MWPCIISLKVQSFLLYYFETNLSIVKLLLMKIAWKVVLWSSKDEEIAFIRVFTFSCIPCGLISLGWHCQKNNVKKWAFGKTVYSGGSGDGSGWPYNGGGGGLPIQKRSWNYLHTTWYKRHKRYWSCFDLFTVKFTDYYHPVVMSLWLFKNEIFLQIKCLLARKTMIKWNTFQPCLPF